MKVKISLGNTKMGKIPSVSLPPIKSCGNCNDCAKHCYAMKAYRQYPLTKAAYDNNYKLATENREQYFSDIREYLKKNKPKYFRWHTAGDILDLKYLFEMNRIATEFKKTKFLCFTKMYGLVDEFLFVRNFAPNFKMFLSAWLDKENISYNKIGIRKHFNLDDLSIARTVNKGDLDRHIGFKCEGNCEQCGFCFESKNGSTVIFEMH